MNHEINQLPFDANQPERHLDDLVHDLLTEEQAAIVQQWCDSDESHAGLLAQARQRKQLLESLGAEKVSRHLLDSTMSRIEGRVDRRARNWKRYRRALFYATAASIALISAFQWYYTNLRATPYDVRVVGQSEWMAGSFGSMQIYVEDVSNRSLVDGVPMELILRDRGRGEEVSLGSFETGEGIPRFEVPDWAAGHYELEIIAEVDGRHESMVQSIELRRPWQLLLTTDKPMYQPGQTVHLRCQALRRPLLKPFAGESVIFRVRDSNGNIIFKKETETSRYGIASADCQLATGIMLGDYQVDCQIGTTSSQRTIKVDRYVLPKLQVGIDFDEPFYGPGDLMSIDIDARYVFDKPVSLGNVELYVEADGLNVGITEPLLETLDEDGRATFAVQLPDRLVGRPQEGGQARVRVVAQVTDQAGQSLVVASSRLVSSQPILVEIVPESPLLLQGEPNIVYVMTRYADGRPATVSLNFNGAAEQVQTNSLGIAQFSLTPSDDIVDVSVVATDDEGLRGTGRVSLSSTDADTSFLARIDRSVYQSGDTMEYRILGGGNAPVFVDLVKDQQTVASFLVPVVDGEGRLDIDIPLDLFGCVRLESYRFGSRGLARRQTRVVMIRQAGELLIETHLDHESYKPGETAQIEFRLTDEDGNPRPGALGVSIVDEALFSLLQSRSGMEQAFFLLEEELLEPVYTIYQDWSPFGGDPIDEGEWVMFEQALFAKTSFVASGESAMRFDDRAIPESPEEATQGATFVSSDTGRVEEVRHDNPYTMSTGNYRAKVDDASARRVRGLKGTRLAWMGLIVTVLCALVAAFAVAFPRTFAVISLVVSSIGLSVGCVLFIGMRFAANDLLMDSMATAESQGADDAMSNWAGGATDSEAMAPTMIAPKDPPRVREQFPETLYWAPQLITDDNGIARLSLPLADSITTWRVSMNSVDLDGRLGSGQTEILSFQEFQVDVNAPVALTRGDRVDLPVVVYNFSEDSQDIEVTLQDADWFELAPEQDAQQTVSLESNSVQVVHYRIRANRVGHNALEVHAIGPVSQDAIRRSIEVVPDGRRIVRTVSGNLNRPFLFEQEIPEDVIEGSVRATVRFYPTTFSQLVEGIDTIFQMPHGCFEQTTSTTYPNVLALSYLRRSNHDSPQVEAKAQQYIHLGYQRLMSFEVNGGGFDWYGNPPASVPLTAYGLMEFKDMSEVHDVDPRMLRRTENWLLRKREADGSWDPAGSGGVGFTGLASNNEEARLLLTAMVAWAVYDRQQSTNDASATRDYLLAYPLDQLNDPYILAMVIHALAVIDPQMTELREYGDKLESLSQQEEDGELIYWERDDDVVNLMYSRGRSGQVETTALSALAMMKLGRGGAVVLPALQWLIAQKDTQGGWHSTQATVLALKALVAGTDSMSGETERVMAITVDQMQSSKLQIPADQYEVVQQVDLSGQLAEPGAHLVSIVEESETAISFQFDLIYHVPDFGGEIEAAEQPLGITVEYDKTRLQVEDTVGVLVQVANHTDQVAPMVMVDLPIPAGFAVETDELERAVDDGTIAKYELTNRQIIVYLRRLAPDEPLELNYRIRATMPVEIQIPNGRAYEYYDPDRRAEGGASRMVVEAA